jgi:hypothetical protein
MRLNGGVLLAVMALTACGKPQTGAPKPGSNEECLVFAMADHTAAPDSFETRYRLGEALKAHFEAGRFAGQKPKAIIARQRQLLAYSRRQAPGSGEGAARAACVERFGLPEPIETENARR